LQKVREEVFTTTRAIYMELLTSRPPLEFHESSEGFGENRDVEQKI
jgi:hypothetical protein